MKRILEIDEDEYYILQRAVDFLNSSCINASNINSKDLYDLDSRLTRIKFKDLPKVSGNK